MGNRVWVGMGSNQGDRRGRLQGAIAALAATPGTTVRAVSTFRETMPVGGPSGQGAYLNAAAALETTLGPFDLLARLFEVEAEAGRVRTVRWGGRPLDLDLLLFSDQRIATPALTVPHPRLAVRRFVIAPLQEIAPDLRDPATGLSMGELLDNLDRRPSVVALVGDPALAATVAQRLRNVLPEDWIVTTNPDDPARRPTFVAALGPTAVHAVPIPTVRLATADCDAVTAEVLAACAATRTG